jgi:hypothetical protein
MSQKVLALGMLLGLLLFFATPAMANHIDTVTVNAGCSSYTITLLASELVSRPGDFVNANPLLRIGVSPAERFC